MAARLIAQNVQSLNMTLRLADFATERKERRFSARDERPSAIVDVTSCETKPCCWRPQQQVFDGSCRRSTEAVGEKEKSW